VRGLAACGVAGLAPRLPRAIDVAGQRVGGGPRNRAHACDPPRRTFVAPLTPLTFGKSCSRSRSASGTYAYVDEDLPDSEFETTLAGTQLEIKKDIHALIREVHPQVEEIRDMVESLESSSRAGDE
jgi:hypothetical protein